MRTDDPPSELAEEYAAKARTEYEENGAIAPMVSLLSDAQQVIVIPKGTDDVPLAFGSVVLVMAAAMAPHTVITVSEGWMKRYNVTDFDGKPSLRRGQLGEMAAAGDASVHTALMTHVWRLDPAEQEAVIDLVADTKGVYERTVDRGGMEGNLADNVMGGWKRALGAPVVTDRVEAIKVACKVLGEFGLISSVLVASDAE